MEQVTRQQNPEYECRIDFDRGQPTGPRHRAADVERAYDHLNWEPTTKLRDGIAKTIDWYFNKYSVEEAEQQLTKLKDR
jgi:nucleoside-diphosphate-sugar epimerase